MKLAPLPLAKLEANHAHAEAFKALSHLTRLQIFFFLVRAQGEVAVGEIQEALEVPGPTLSHHLDKLRRAGLIESRRERPAVAAFLTALADPAVRAQISALGMTPV